MKDCRKNYDLHRVYEWGWHPPFWYAVFRGCFKRRYAVRKGSVRSTQKSCYIVRSYLVLLLKGPIFIKKHNKRDVQSQIILNFSRVCFACAFWGVISAFINLNNKPSQKLGNNTSKHINANVCNNGRTSACNRLSFYLLYVNENAKKW